MYALSIGAVFSDFEMNPRPDFNRSSLFDVGYLRNGTR